MKIGIYAGTIPPPVFINNLVNGSADNGYEVFIYGKAANRNYKFSNSYIIQRIFPSTKIGILLYSIYILLQLILRTPRSNLTIIKMVKQNSNSLSQFFQRTCRVLPPFLDKLEVFHIQWAKVLVQYPEFIEKIKGSLRDGYIEGIPTSGGYEIACAQLCGNSHYKMKGYMTIHSQEEYDNWLSQEAEYLESEGEDDWDDEW